MSHAALGYDAGVTVGGPIVRDKVWFFGALRRWGTKTPSIGLYLNANQGGLTYEPPLHWNRTRVASSRTWVGSPPSSRPSRLQVLPTPTSLSTTSRPPSS